MFTGEKAEDGREAASRSNSECCFLERTGVAHGLIQLYLGMFLEMIPQSHFTSVPAGEANKSVSSSSGGSSFSCYVLVNRTSC